MISQSVSNRTLLVVDDDEDIRETLKEILELEGYHVITAVNGEDGIEKLRQNSGTNLVLLDMMMPIMSGDRFIEVANRDHLLQSIPVIVFSANSDRILSTGAVKLLRKPVDLNCLLKWVDRYSKPSYALS